MGESKNIVKIIVIALVVFSICALGIFFLDYLISDNNVIKGYYKTKEYFNKFKEWMDACDRLNVYDFDENIIDNNDFYLLYDKSNHNNSIEYKKFEYFTIHFYDTNSHILYYIHANI